MSANSSYMKHTRAEWKRNGICTRCGKGEPKVNYTRCDGCLELDRLRKRKHPLATQPQEAHSSSNA